MEARDGDLFVMEPHSHCEESGDNGDQKTYRVEPPKLTVSLSDKDIMEIIDNVKLEEEEKSVITEVSRFDNEIEEPEEMEGSYHRQYVRVFIQRDYTAGRFVRFNSAFPQELEGKIERETFAATINGINKHLAEPENISCNTCTEGCLACLTAHLIYIFKPTPYEKCLNNVSKFVAEENEIEYEPKGLKLTDPSLRGLRVIQISSLENQ